MHANTVSACLINATFIYNTDGSRPYINKTVHARFLWHHFCDQLQTDVVGIYLKILYLYALYIFNLVVWYGD